MAAEFDPEDRTSWYFGAITRSDTNNLLQKENSCGVFLVRDSTSIKGDLVLCVKEDSKVSHYIINKLSGQEGIKYRIGDQEFTSIPNLLQFYKTHYLDTTSLIRPAQREKFIAQFDFPGTDAEDLPFKRGDILLILQKDEEQWWTAKNPKTSATGLVPVPYIKEYSKDLEAQMNGPQHPPPVQPTVVDQNGSAPKPPSSFQNGQMRQLPSQARVKQQRIPCAYDSTLLRLEVGDIVNVLAMNPDGQWEGEVNGRRGFFPFNHVRFLDSEDPDSEQNSLD